MRLLRQKNYDKLLLSGGPFPVLFPEKYLDCCDIIINGEGEKTFCQLVKEYSRNRRFSKSAIAGISFKEDGRIIRSKDRELIGELDGIMFPDYKVLTPPIEYYSRGARIVGRIMAPLLTSRGCPYQCTYCNKSVFGSRFRFRSPDNIIREIEWLGENFGVDQIDILDDNFNLIPARAEEVLEKIVAKKLKLAISCHNGLRADRISPSLVQKLKKAGVFKVGLGIETGDPLMLKSIHKNLDLNRVREAVSLLRRQGLTVHGYFIIGLPYDNPLTMQRTIDFAREINPHFCNFATCIPFPGTAVHRRIREEGRFLVDVDNGVNSGFFDGQVFFEIDGTKAADVRLYYKKAYRDFYFHLSKAVDILSSLKSFQELIWILKTSFSILSNALLGPAKKDQR
jgi:radical SAM superfamily enzyme YgiQ (UPF0313 family)